MFPLNQVQTAAQLMVATASRQVGVLEDGLDIILARGLRSCAIATWRFRLPLNLLLIIDQCLIGVGFAQ